MSDLPDINNRGVKFDADLIRRHDVMGPRYTSYPTAVQFRDDFNVYDFTHVAERSRINGGPLSLYFHLPFCDHVCYYCACNKIVTRDHSKVAPYIDHLKTEMNRVAPLLDNTRPIRQLHWGGGTPTFLDHAQMSELMDAIAGSFSLQTDDKRDYSIEIDPRVASEQTIQHLASLGFNRISVGVQDFDEQVQKAVHRIQSEAETLAVIDAARSAGFRSLNVDLIYGLPFQNLKRFARTLERIIQIAPDRLAIYNYAHMPHLFKPQRRIQADDLPSAEEKLAILQYTVERLTNAGYVYIGMDHFARPDDELAVALRSGSLHRNFQGYSTHADCDLAAFGVSSIARLDDCYIQNHRDIEGYYKALDNGDLPVAKGIRLNQDDLIRRDLIQRILCQGGFEVVDIEIRYSIEFLDYFSDTLTRLWDMANDGLIKWDGYRLAVLPAGRMLMRNIAMAFDHYQTQATEQRHSRMI